MGTTPRSRSARSILVSMTLAVGAALVGIAVAPAASASAPSVTGSVAAAVSVDCPTVYWGSLAKERAGSTISAIIGVRTGMHQCYDRVVVDLAGGGRLGFDVRYVGAVTQEGSGAPVPVRGGATIQIVVRAPAYSTSTGTVTYHPANPRELTNVTGYRTLRQLAYAGSFEGQTTIALGVRARLPMRVFVLDGPGAGQRLVIDIAHRW